MKVADRRPAASMAIGKTIEVYDAESIGFLRFSVEGARQASPPPPRSLLRSPEGLGRWYLSVINDWPAPSVDDERLRSIHRGPRMG
jgi:choline kinase